MTIWKVPATIQAIHDGDTVTVLADLGWHISLVTPVRLAGVDAPELATPEGKTALAFVVALMPIGTVVTLTSHSLDKYGRVLGTITLPDGTDLSETLIQHGQGKPYFGGKR